MAEFGVSGQNKGVSQPLCCCSGDATQVSAVLHFGLRAIFFARIVFRRFR
jgi:hypothetical protein